jgi:plasmid maintenance system antidote protein VapI
VAGKAQWQEWVAATRESPELAVEHAKLDFALALERVMVQQGANRAALSRRMGTSAAAVSVALRGDANLTIDRMVRMAAALDASVHIHVAPQAANVHWMESFSGQTEEQRRNAASWAKHAAGGACEQCSILIPA